MTTDDESPTERIHPVKLFDVAKSEGRPLYVSAPMVRYSKLPFRLLVQNYGVDLTYTPMILAHEFIRHPIARSSDFSTHATEGPVIAQFAANNPIDYSRATQLIAPWVNGVDLNCGCPQSWAIKEGIGCSLMNDRGLVSDLAKAARSAVGLGKSVSIKIRVHKDLRQTIDLIRTAETAGIDFITIHHRTAHQRSSTPPLYDALPILKSATTVPLIFNGAVTSLHPSKPTRPSQPTFTSTDSPTTDGTNRTDTSEETIDPTSASSLHQRYNLDGIMAAQGLLENPALFAGYTSTPVHVIEEFMNYAVRGGLRTELIQHHLGEMMGKMVSKRDRKKLFDLRDLIEVCDWVEGVLGGGV